MSFGKDVHDTILGIKAKTSEQPGYLRPGTAAPVLIESSSEHSISIHTNSGKSHGLEIINTNLLDRIAIVAMPPSEAR